MEKRQVPKPSRAAVVYYVMWENVQMESSSAATLWSSSFLTFSFATANASHKDTLFAYPEPTKTRDPYIPLYPHPQRIGLLVGIYTGAAKVPL